MAVANDLWQAHQALALACLEHPFVRGLGDGSLARDRFAYYVGQDAFFLESFLRAYCIAAAKAPDWQGAQVFHQLAQGVLAELKLHQSYAKQWQVDLAEVKAGSATRRYTDFLLATAWRHEVGITTAAMLPCMKLYSYLGQQLAQDGIPEHQYSDWIDTYSSDEFSPLVEQLEQLAEQYTPDSAMAFGRSETIARDTYGYAMQCEFDFFQAAWDTNSQSI
jgi:thiaminase/transcriptional activator TenA